MFSRVMPLRFPLKRLLAAFLLLLLITSPALAENWAFTVIGDNLSFFASYRNVLNEIRRQTVNPDKRFPPFDFVLACGDISPVEENFRIFREVFSSGGPSFFPVRGNHERAGDIRFLLEKIMLPHGKNTNRQDEKNLNYYTDWKNVRLIVLDQYSSRGKAFDSEATVVWLKGALDTPERIRHIFVAFHEPYLPFHPEKNPLWSLLLEHRNKVRAVFAGHTHRYYRERFPDEKTGILFVNTGNAGQNSHSDDRQTITEVLIEGEKVSFQVVQTPDGTSDFSVREQW
jgi:predicted phosphodiesterase